MKKIKVVFVHYKLVCGGAEQALFDLVTLLDKEKFDVEVFVQIPGGDWDQRFLDAGVKLVYDYSCRQPTWNPVKKLGNFQKKCQVSRALKSGGAGLLDLCCPGADIVVDYSAWCFPEISFASGAKSVKFIHGDPATNPVYHQEAATEQDRLKRFHRIVCVSKKAAEAFREISGLNETVQMHYNPLNTEEVRRKAQTEVDLPQDVPLVCAVGRLAREKGFERLLVAHKNLLDAGICHKLVLVGDGPEQDFLIRLAQALRVESSVIFAGYQSNPYPYMKAAKFLVSSSFTEGLPVISMEALTLGVPMVATVPSVGEVFGEEPCGLIVENSMEGLEYGMKKMLTEPEFYTQAKAAALRRSTFFDGRRMVKEIEDMLLGLV